ncbi:MAG: NAD/NADP octopine/nopaline dehydrogenase family protein [Acetivibrionales bacterium]|jgi:hypothetical protein
MKEFNLPIEKLNRNEKVNICILGGGNIGTLLMADLSQDKRVSVRLLTTNPAKWCKVIEVYNKNENIEFTGKLDIVSNNPADVIPDADIIISTVPSHAFFDILNRIEVFIKEGAWVGIMPGSGGCEFYLKKLIERNCIIFGFQRVHGIARIKTYGKSVYNLGKKNELYIASIPSEMSSIVANVIESFIRIKCTPLTNYLAVTLTPSNPILHTSRLFSLFGNKPKDYIWENELEFYCDWTDADSQVLFACDDELQKFCNAIKDIDLSAVKSLKDHYESYSIKEMTGKIKSIPAFRGIKAPMVSKKHGFAPDYGSRYFIEDFPYGLCIIKSFCYISKIDTPMIDQILGWFENLYDLEYFINSEFIGKDLAKLPIPQNHGIYSIEDIIRYYTDCNLTY